MRVATWRWNLWRRYLTALFRALIIALLTLTILLATTLSMEPDISQAGFEPRVMLRV